MSIARRVTMRCLLGTGAVVVALSAGTTSAWASGTPGGDGWEKSGRAYTSGQGPGTVTETDRCQFSLDGTEFADSVRVDDLNLRPTEDGKVHIKVRTAQDATTCTASLAAYRTHGATFKTSGVQVFHDFDTVTVKQGETDSLDISVPDAGCFAQVDLYRGKVRFDGRADANDGFEHGDVPQGPDRPVIKDKLIAAWNGGTKDCTSQTPDTPATTPPASTPPASTAPASAPPASTTPSAPETESTPSAAESTTAAAPTPNGGESTPAGDLAETGGGNTLPIAGGAAALLAAGAAIAVATRRRTAKSRS
ncbi:LAETG motif-containing sortase-dependent surface protein [Streptomyces sp. NPDC005551]|uniref:LAETG motif-containing sortase-dependent surface protein n=1 Tax=unclassified Streptomyces TaxID=2593676 RepID=UPI0034055B0C